MPGVDAGAVRGGEEHIRHGGLQPGDLRAPAFGDRLAVEDQRVLREIDDQRQTNGDCETDLEGRADQVLWYSSPPFLTNSTDFSCIPRST